MKTMAQATMREAGPPVRLRRAQLLVASGPTKGQKVDVPEEGVAIGSDPACQLVVDDPTVSRRHAEIRKSGLGFALKDLGSTNGTFVGKHRIESVYLADGTSFRVGRTSFTFSTGEDAVDVQASAADALEDLVGASAVMRALYGAIQRFAPTELPVVIEGETGAGKELVARALHLRSARAKGPFVALNCAAFSAGLVEDELFGHEEGAFTGASRQRAGAFEQADGGTLFLDEVGDLPLELQPKLLRVLETFAVRRLGGTRERTVNIRVLAATNHDLGADVTAGKFRRDLFFRLSGVRLTLPRLTERLEDIPALVHHFAKGSGKTFSPEALGALAKRPWTGNVRELASVVRRAIAESPSERVGPEHLGADGPAAPARAGGLVVPVSIDKPIEEARDEVLAAFHRAYLEGLLARHKGDRKAAAEAAGIHVNSMHRLLRNAGID